MSIAEMHKRTKIPTQISTITQIGVASRLVGVPATLFAGRGSEPRQQSTRSVPDMAQPASIKVPVQPPVALLQVPSIPAKEHSAPRGIEAGGITGPLGSRQHRAGLLSCGGQPTSTQTPPVVQASSTLTHVPVTLAKKQRFVPGINPIEGVCVFGRKGLNGGAGAKINAPGVGNSGTV